MTQTAGHRETWPGKDLGRKDFTVDETLLNDFTGGLQLDAAWYRERSQYARPLAPSLIVASFEERMSGGAFFRNTFGTLWMRQVWSFHQPVLAGETYSASARVVNIYEHRNRTVVSFETTLATPDGKTVAVGNHHQSFLLDQSTGKVALRDPKAKEGVRRWDPPEGERLEPLRRTMSLEMCNVFFHRGKNYHTELTAAERLGFSNVVVGGRMTLGLLGSLLDRRFGRGWYEGGSLEVKFTNVTWPGDEVSANAIITNRTHEGTRTKCDLALWVEKSDGTVAIVGTGIAWE